MKQVMIKYVIFWLDRNNYGFSKFSVFSFFVFFFFFLIFVFFTSSSSTISVSLIQWSAISPDCSLSCLDYSANNR